MYENRSVGATFEQDTRDSDQDGLSNWAELVLHGTDPNDLDSDGDGFLDGVEISEDTNPNAAHSYPTRVLTVSNTGNGTVSGAGTYRLGTDATLEASPTLGYHFTGWTGDDSGTDNPLVIVMGGNRSVGATFAQDTRDPDQDGLNTYRELIFPRTDPNDPDSDGDGWNDGDEVSLGYSPISAQSTPPSTPAFSALRLPSGAVDALQVTFPTRSGRSYRIEESLDLQVWTVWEAGITGNGVIIHRRVPASGQKGFVRVVED